MKQKIIEEMAKVLEGDCGECYTCKYFEHKGTNCTYLLGAEYLYNAGYRKIPENAVVLTREEFEKHKGFSREEVDEISETAIKNSRKETAEKFALKLADYFVEHCGSKLSISLTLQEWYKMIDEIAKEITEVK